MDRSNAMEPARPATTDETPPQTDIKEFILLAPRLIKLLWKLMRDPRVPARSKATLIVLAAYLVSPIDLIPDAIPGLGQIDDLFLAAFALDQVLNRVPEEVVLDHWDGDEDVLQIIKQILDISTGMVPGFIKKRL
jgi:uncharacterized membrane protein YkvA (DUF1232 family)